ncbi:MAG: prepilin-type N-terminal cleavage/methylation domain-containing protein [Candidatus Omnitrophica bacterium]|nr:prepilin-type N-terminal cleavage/methylation domain-containing protein [Candidatus Omnitrophota bacterium]
MKLSVKGFTLSELLLAVAILLIAICGLLFASVSCILMNESNNNLVIAVNDAQYVLEQIKGLAYADIDNYEPPDFDNLNNETITLDLDKSDVTRIRTVTVNVSWQERGRQRSFSLPTRIAR